jgi:hypothetical protein
MEISEERVKLLLDLENIIGNECYNPKMRNYGSFGVREGDGRRYRYPITFIDSQGNKDKRRDPIAAIPPPEIAITGYYQVGINQLQIIRALNKLVDYLEQKHNLKV